MSPFQTDASIIAESVLAQLPPQGSQEIRGFCGELGASLDERGPLVLMASKGCGKSHLLRVRSARHRDSDAGARLIFYPQGGLPRTLVETLTQLRLQIPRWLQGREAIPAWSDIWQLSIIGLLVWITEANREGLRAYGDWFGELAESTARIPDVVLKAFIGRVVERLPADDFQAGTDLLKQGLYHANNDWALSIKAALQNLHRSGVVLYLDAPDELVSLTEHAVWRNLQQGLLLAIWQFTKDTNWNSVVTTYASVRSEAFGTGMDANIHLAMNLVLPLRYDVPALEAMLDDRIRAADPARLSLPVNTPPAKPGALGCEPLKAADADR